ncbi:hypothetical protein KR084_008805 [Drosophila pseudotakahashii]|nr:hypothetical protein KR084_008805 [Drosophila pseudotakahashii]
MLLNLIYGVLETISNAIYTTVATIWSVERKWIDLDRAISERSDPAEALINLMMSTFLFVLGVACHPLMVIPMLMGGYYILRNCWYRRVKNPRVENSVDNDGVLKTPGTGYIPRTPRLNAFRSFGNLSTPSNEAPNEN